MHSLMKEVYYHHVNAVAGAGMRGGERRKSEIRECEPTPMPPDAGLCAHKALRCGPPAGDVQRPVRVGIP